MLGCFAEAVVTSASELNVLSLTTLFGDGASTGQSANILRRRETGSIFAKQHQQFGLQQVTGTWKRCKDGVIGMFFI